MILDVDVIERDRMTIPRLWRKVGGKVTYEEVPFHPYFLVRQPTVPQKKQELLDVLNKVFGPSGQFLGCAPVEKVIGEQRSEFLRVECRNVEDVRPMSDTIRRNGFDIHEYDIPFHSSVLIHQNEAPLDGSEPLTYLAVDIETPKGKGIPSPKWAENVPIEIISISYREQNQEIAWALASRDGKTEADLLREFVSLVRLKDPDVIVTYNGNGFDWPFIIRRAQLLGVDLNMGRDGSNLVMAKRFKEPICAGRHLVDLLQIVKRDYLDIKVKSLKNVASTLGVLSTENRVMIPGNRIGIEWQQNPERVMEYAKDDAKATLRLGELLVGQLVPWTKDAKSRLTETAHAKRGRQVEHLLMARSVEQSRIIPPVHRSDGSEETFEGAFVFDPIQGLRENIRVVDVGGMYPTIVVEHNLSPETFCPNYPACNRTHSVAPDVGHAFHTDVQGFVPSVVADLKAKRAELKKTLKTLKKGSVEYVRVDAEQSAKKLGVNSCYGLFGWTESRWFFRPAAESTTGFGRYYIKGTAEEMTKAGITLYGGDTDSLFLADDPRIFPIIEEIQKKYPVVFEDEGLFERGVFPGSKKRYALLKKGGKSVNDMKIRGLETRRGDWCELARNVQVEVLEYILVRGDVKGAVRYVQGIIRDLKSRSIPLDALVISKGVSHPNSYTDIPSHVRAAIRDLSDDDMAAVVDTKVSYVVVKRHNAETLADQIRLLDTFADGEDPIPKLDLAYYQDKQVVPAAMRILGVFKLDGCPIEESTLKTSRSQAGLAKWF